MVVHYTLSLIFPTGSLMRSLFVSLNILSINCRDQEYVSSPSEFGAYGGPIAYLIVQAIVLFTFLVWWEMGTKFSVFRRNKYREPDKEEKESIEPEVAEEVARVQDSTTDGLRVLHLSKSYGKNLAVSDISFGVKRGEVFALLGPNGAGKSTTISVIRGDIKPSNNGGDVFIENISLRKKRTAARQNLGVCPQHDCMDQMTVLEHLRFYARVRGVESIEDNVQEVIRAVGLTKFKTRMGNALSGGNKRKLSLAIALMGNPGVMLLDEPSSGMDVAAKRILWKTLESVVPGRSIVLTTHSMEEADRLCQRAGIMARKMLALGTSNYLRKKHGDRYHVHLLLKSAPYTTPEEAEKARQWVLDTFSGVETEDRALHGQLRFSVPANSKVRTTTNGDEIKPVGGNSMAGIASLFDTLEKNKEVVGFQYYSVSQTTLDQVFLGIVSKHNVQEENSGDGKMRKERKGFFGLGPVRWLLCLG